MDIVSQEISVFVLGVDLQVFACFPAQAAASIPVVKFGTLVAGGDIFPPAISRCIVAHRQATRQAVSQRPGKHQVVLLRTVLDFVHGLHQSFELIGGLGGGDIDRASNRILAKQNALGPFEDFNALEVHRGWNRRQWPAPGVHAIDIHAHRLFEALVGAGTNATNEQVGRP